MGHLPRAELVDLFMRCHAYLVPGEEDFGIAPVEAMAAGKPVVAFGRGGAAETVIDGVTGVLFSKQSTLGIAEAIERLDSITFDRAAIREHARQFDRQAFFASWRALHGTPGRSGRALLVRRLPDGRPGRGMRNRRESTAMRD